MPPRDRVLAGSRAVRIAQAAIAFGLAMLIAGAWFPAAPATAVALVAMGATHLTLARFRASPALVPVMVMHLATYGSLYALFVGATLHASGMHSMRSASSSAAADIAVSTLPMAAAMIRTYHALMPPFGQHG